MKLTKGCMNPNAMCEVEVGICLGSTKKVITNFYDAVEYINENGLRRL